MTVAMLLRNTLKAKRAGPRMNQEQETLRKLDRLW